MTVLTAVFQTAVALSAAYLLYSWLAVKAKSNDLPLPPGPKGWPIIGNLLQLPIEKSWEVHHNWCKEFDTNILYLNAAGMPIIILDKYEDCAALLDRRSSIYSGRMRMPMVGELMGWDFHLAGINYGPVWKNHRRLMHESFHPAAAKLFQPLQLKTARKFLARLGKNTEVMPALRHMMSETVISITYGLEIQGENDPHIETAEKAIDGLANVPYAGAFMVDIFPSLKYVPAWMPGASFKRKAREWRLLTLDMVNKPFNSLKTQMKLGTAKPSFAYNSLQRMSAEDELYTEENIKHVAGTMYQAGVDTTQTTLAFCILSLLANPQMMKKIQTELDSFTHGLRLPDFEDEEEVPYLKAFIKEALRFWSFIPSPIPRCLAVEDEYKGYRFPAGSLIMPNTWAILHDEDVFVNPFEFNPERFISGNNLKEINAHYATAWGYGRRICPGRHMAVSTVWITLAQILAVYNIQKAVDGDGNTMEPKMDLSSFGITLSVFPFQCTFLPRSENAKTLILTANGKD